MTIDNGSGDTVVTVEGAAELLGIGHRYLKALLNSGALASYQVGPHRHIRAEELADLARRRREAAKFVAEAQSVRTEKLPDITDTALAVLDDL